MPSNASATGVPVIHFGTESAGILADMRDAGGDILGADWRIDIDKAADILGDDVAIQGNLDPVVLAVGGAVLRREVDAILDILARGPFVFNLGHGVLQVTPPEHVAELTALIRSWPERRSNP